MKPTSEIDDLLEPGVEARQPDLLPILSAAQERLGYLSRETLEAISQRLNLPVTTVYGVATFYDFRLQPRGKVHCEVCRGTACHLHGAETVLETFKRVLKINPGETTRDGQFSLDAVTCLGACAQAPVAAVGPQVHLRVKPGQVGEHLRAGGEQSKDNADV